MHYLQPKKEIDTWEKLTQGKAATAELVIRIDGRRFVTRKDLVRIWDVSDDTIKKYIAKGMPKSPELSVPLMSVFDLAEVNTWRDQNIDPKNDHTRKARIRAAKENPEEHTERDIPVEQSAYAIRSLIATTEKEEEQAKLAKLKRMKEEGTLVNADDLDRTMAEQAVLHKSEKINDEKVLPTLLEMKPASEIAVLLYDHNKKRLDQLDELINREFPKSEVSMYEVIGIVIDRLKNGATVEELHECLSS